MSISRRRLLQTSAAGAAVLATHPIRSAMFGANLAHAAPPTNAVFVFLQLEGGNDGLNTVIPIDDNGSSNQRSLYEAVRPNIRIPLADLAATELDPDEDGTGVALHPSMTGIKQLYDAGKVAVINGVAYPNQNLSHFASEDIWFGADPNGPFQSGWFGRYLDEQYSPSELVTVDFDSTLSKTFFSSSSNVLALRLLSNFKLSDDPLAPDLAAKKARLAQAYGVEQDPGETSGLQNVVGVAGDVLLDKMEEYGAISTNWSSNLNPLTGSLARRLKQVASVLRHDVISGSPVGARFFHVRLGGFDTHSDQGALIGRQSLLLGELSADVKAFYDDLVSIGGGLPERTLLVTMSEFGRRVAENGGVGTDHGEASCLLAIGDPVAGGVYGAIPPLDDLRQGNLKWQIDFRQVYASVIDDWLGADHTTLLPDQPFQKIPFIQT